MNVRSALRDTRTRAGLTQADLARGRQPLVVPSQSRHRRSGRALVDVLALAELLPTRHSSELEFPRLRPSAGKP